MRETVSGRARVQVITASQVEMNLLQHLLEAFGSVVHDAELEAVLLLVTAS
jgi:DNA-binding winged helix-turn-helix (wHTH) protein